MIATIGLRNHSADSVSVTAIPVSLKGACTVGLARSDPTAQPRISAVSVAVRSGNLADAPHVHGEAPLHARSQDNMDDCALQESSRARGGVQLKRKQAENFLPGILDIACSSIFLSSRGTSWRKELLQFRIIMCDMLNVKSTDNSAGE